MPRRREAPRQAVVKMSVTSSVKRPPDEGSNSIDRSPPTPTTARGEDRCYFVCNTRGRGFESRPAFHAPVAQRIERYPAPKGLGSQQSPVPGPCLRKRVWSARQTARAAGGEESCYFVNRKVGGSNPPGRETAPLAQLDRACDAREGKSALACSPAPFFNHNPTRRLP